MITEEEKERLELALKIISGRKEELTPHECLLFGLPTHYSRISKIRECAESVVYELICRALYVPPMDNQRKVYG